MQEETKRVLLSLREKLVLPAQEFEKNGEDLFHAGNGVVSLVNAGIYAGRAKGLGMCILEIDNTLHCSETFGEEKGQR